MAKENSQSAIQQIAKNDRFYRSKSNNKTVDRKNSRGSDPRKIMKFFMHNQMQSAESFEQIKSHILWKIQVTLEDPVSIVQSLEQGKEVGPIVPVRQHSSLVDNKDRLFDQ